MSDRIEGQRDSHGDKWSWGPPGGTRPPQERGRPPRFPWRPVLLVLAAIAVVGTGVGLLALANDDGDGAGSAGTSETDAPRPTRPEQGSAPAGTGTVPALSPTSAEVRLFAWSRSEGEWLEGALPPEAGYKEGDTVPMLLQIASATQGSFYETIVRYHCGTDNAAGFDYLDSPVEEDSKAVLTDPAPGRLRPDSTVPIPDDPSITFGADSDSRFQLWGATFQQSLQGPLPADPCDGEKEFHLIAVAASDSVSLVWAAHLASAEDWGQDEGSASVDEPLTIDVSVVGTGDVSLTVPVGAIAP